MYKYAQIYIYIYTHIHVHARTRAAVSYHLKSSPCTNTCICTCVYIYIYMVPPCTYTLLSDGAWTLTTLMLTRKTMNNYALTTKILQQATASKNMIFKPILRTRNSWLFSLQWFRALDHQNRKKPIKTTRNHDKPPKPL